MLEREYWDYHQEWLEYVKRAWAGPDRVQQIKEQTEESLAFRERAKEAFESKGIPCKTVKTYLSIQVPAEGEGYESNYPHIHYPLNTTTLIHYLQPGDKPAPLQVLESEHGPLLESITPEPGLTVFMPHTTWHGALKNHGIEDRIQLIATALR